MMKDYLGSTRNPNLKLGEINDAGDAFEAEILTKNNDLVDRILIDKGNGLYEIGLLGTGRIFGLTFNLVSRG
jgi:hypothetical protein